MHRQVSKEPKYPSMLQLRTRGTHYDVGYNTGLHFSSHIKLFLAESDRIQDKLLPFYNTRAGRDYYDKRLKVCENSFPQYVRELRGIADGSGLPFEQMFMANISEEVYSILHGQEASAADSSYQEYGCSEVFVNRPGCKYLLHNEDCEPAIKLHGYLLSAEIEEDGVKEHFTSFCYPGVLPGCAFSHNLHGLTVSINLLCPAHIVQEAPSWVFVNRSLLRARDTQDAIRLAANEPHGVAYGFCANLSDKEGVMTSVEVAPGKPRGLVHVHTVTEESDPDTDCHYYHFNTYKHLREVPETQGLHSSSRRSQRARELPPPRTLQQALGVLADSGDPLGPIFRTPRPSDPGETACTVAYDVTRRQVFLYQGREDLLNNRPLTTLPM